MNRGPTEESTVQPLVDTLLEQAYLFDDPGAYRAGVLDAIDALGASPGSGTIERHPEAATA